jgi:exodeoxyribonuclease VII large subunit
MPEQRSDKQIFSLQEVTASIGRTLTGRYGSPFWVKAEMIRLNPYPHSGHCYPELVEKREGKVVAQMRAILWENDYSRINRHFLEVLKEPLKDGVKILFCASICFDPVHGLSLRILDIDPGFTLGDLEREKQRTIERLTREGIFLQNRQLPLALLPQRIAVISVETSKGYADFRHVIEENGYGYRFFLLLFPALLQGDKAAGSIGRQLRRIRLVREHFDAVVLIRGGGADLGLSCYNDYSLCREIASFPLPVFAGIGHATNDTVAGMAAFRNAITPTKVAECLLQCFHDFAVPVAGAEDKIASKARSLLREERERLSGSLRYFRSVAGGGVLHHGHEIRRLSSALGRQSLLMLRQAGAMCTQMDTSIRKGSAALGLHARRDISLMQPALAKAAATLLEKQSGLLEAADKNVSNMDPRNVLKRGYSITLAGGRAVTSAAELSEGEMVTTLLALGSATSEIKTIKKQPDDD